jgi:hypothetical protein
MEEKKKGAKEKYFSLYFAEPGFGTKLFDHENTMKGLAFALEKNGLSSKIEQVLVQGGVIPHVPPYTSKSYLNDLKLLGHIKKKPNEKKTTSDAMLEDRLMSPYEQEYYNKNVHTEKTRKIESIEDAFEVAGQQLSILMNSLPKTTPLRIQAGEEDTKNIGYLEMLKIKNASKERNEQLEKKFEEIINTKLKLTEDLIEPKIKKYVFSKVLENRDYKAKPSESRGEYYDRLTPIFKKDVTRIYNELIPQEKSKNNRKKRMGGRDEQLSQAIKHVKWAQERNKTEEKLKEFEDLISFIKEEDYELKKQAQSINRNVKWSQSLLDKGTKQAVAYFTNQIPISAGESEIYWASAKEDYTKRFQELGIEQPVYYHITGRKEFFTGDKIEMNKETGKKNTSGKKKGKHIFMAHNLRKAFSDAISPKSIKEGKLDLNKRNLTTNKMIEESQSPDYLLLGGHDTGGFRVQPWFKESERSEKDVFVKDQKIAWLISLPTLQDQDKLDWAVAHNFSGWDIKRYLSGPWASGVVLHSEKEDGVNSFEVWDTRKLIEWGKISSEVEVYKSSLNDSKISKNNKEKLKKTIKRLETKVKINYEKMETAGDFHLGAPANKDRYSTDQLIEAGHIYQMENGLPKIIAWDEIPNGLQYFHGAESEYMGDIAPKMKKKFEEIEKRKNLTKDQKIDLIIKESLKNQRANPVFNSADQKEYFSRVLKPYADKILEMDDRNKVLLFSGNHFNKSHKNSDEASELSLQFPWKYRDNGRVITIEGKGNAVGTGTITLPGGQKLYTIHKMPERMDEIYGAMTHLRKANNDSDIVFAGDRHQTGAGYADNHFITVHPGLQSMNHYVETIGKPAGLRGFQNVFYDQNKRGVYKVDFVLNNTLEKIIEDKNIR